MYINCTSRNAPAPAYAWHGTGAGTHQQPTHPRGVRGISFSSGCSSSKNGTSRNGSPCYVHSKYSEAAQHGRTAPACSQLLVFVHMCQWVCMCVCACMCVYGCGCVGLKGGCDHNSKAHTACVHAAVCVYRVCTGCVPRFKIHHSSHRQREFKGNGIWRCVQAMRLSSKACIQCCARGYAYRVHTRPAPPFTSARQPNDWIRCVRPVRRARPRRQKEWVPGHCHPGDHEVLRVLTVAAIILIVDQRRPPRAARPFPTP